MVDRSRIAQSAEEAKAAKEKRANDDRGRRRSDTQSAEEAKAAKEKKANDDHERRTTQSAEEAKAAKEKKANDDHDRRASAIGAKKQEEAAKQQRRQDAHGAYYSTTSNAWFSREASWCFDSDAGQVPAVVDNTPTGARAFAALER